MEINYEIMNEKITVSKVSFYWLFKFMWRTLFYEKAVVVINILCVAISIIFSIIFQVFMAQQEQVVILFNYYFIFFVSMLMFILGLRISMVMWSNKMDDQTVMNLVISNNSRTRIIVAFFVCALVNIFTTVAINSAIIIIPELVHNPTGVLVKNTFVAAGYTILTIGSILWFLTFGMIFFNRNVALMISVLILTLQLVSAIPQKFHLTKEESTYLTLKDNSIYSVSRIRNVLDLQQHVADSQIRYPELSQFINQWFIQNNFKKGNTFSNAASLKLRKEFWSQLGLIDTTNVQTVSLDGQTITKLPSGWSNFNLSDVVNLKVVYQDNFIDYAGLQAIANSSTILSQFNSFVDDLLANFANDLEFQTNYINKFDNFVDVTSCQDVNTETGTCNDDGSFITAVGTPAATVALTTSDIVALYQNYFLDAANGFGLSKSNPNLQTFITSQLFNPVRLAARVLEDYFVNSTSDFITITTTDVVINTAYAAYARSTVVNNLLYWLNPIASVQSVYTNYSGISTDDVWFEYLNTSNILFNKQSNLFLTYPLYSIKLQDGVISSDSYRNYTPVWIFIVVLITLTLLVAAISIQKFNRMDLN